MVRVSGAILRARNGDAVTGLTTAATIWIVAAVGIACGGGRWTASVALVVLVEGILVLGRRVDNVLRHHTVGTARDARHKDM